MITEELSHEFDFVTINVDDIGEFMRQRWGLVIGTFSVFSYLPNKVANTVKDTVEIQTLMKKDRRLVTLDWIMNLISAKLSTSTNRRFIIDIVPELNSILRMDSFTSYRFDEQLSHFERRVSSILKLSMPILLAPNNDGIGVVCQ